MAAFMLCGLMLIFNGKSLEGEFIPYIGLIKYYVLGLVIGLALLMVSNVPYRNFRSLFLKRRLPFYFLIFIMCGLMILAVRPLWTIFLIGLIYILSGPIISALRFMIPRRRREPDPGANI